MEAIVAGDVVDNRPYKVARSVDLHIDAAMQTRLDGFAAVMLQHIHCYDGICCAEIRQEPAEQGATPIKNHQDNGPAMAADALAHETEKVERPLRSLFLDVLVLKLEDGWIHCREKEEEVQPLPLVLHLCGVQVIFHQLREDVVVLVVCGLVCLCRETKCCGKHQPPKELNCRVCEDGAVHSIVHHSCDAEG